MTDKWKPIKTAPKDGTPLLLWATRFGWEAGGYAVVCGVYYQKQWRIYGAAQGQPQKDRLTPCQWLDEVLPSHWQPQPAPPTRKK